MTQTIPDWFFSLIQHLFVIETIVEHANDWMDTT
jgi:hypothetical protein